MSTDAATKAAPAQPSQVQQFIKSSLQQLFVFAALIVVFVFFMIFAPNFNAGVVIPNILLQAAAIGTMALGATFVIATGGIDLSVGTGMTFATLAMMMVTRGLSLIISNASSIKIANPDYSAISNDHTIRASVIRRSESEKVRPRYLSSNQEGSRSR